MAKKTKDDLLKMVFSILLIIILVAGIFSLSSLFTMSNNQARFTGPSANSQWQNAMNWVRNSTPQNSIFLHWWDYGYWVQSLGKRRTIADGGHIQGPFQNHLVGRYVLTTPKPETALSYMKSQNVSHLLIDPTDLGKYGAYSKIGSGREGIDRYSAIPTMFQNEQQTLEEENITKILYQGVSAVDQDIIYEVQGREILLPQDKAFVIGVFLEVRDIEGSSTIEQPNGVFVYNNEQISIPLRYVYANGQILDFGSGINATLYAMPSISPGSSGLQINNMGTILYLSPKVSESLFAQIYLMDDPFDQYGSLELAHSELDPVVASIRSQGGNIPEIVYYNGFRGPIKIWEVQEFPEDIIAHEELRDRTIREWGSLDGLKFAK